MKIIMELEEDAVWWRSRPSKPCGGQKCPWWVRFLPLPFINSPCMGLFTGVSCVSVKGKLPHTQNVMKKLRFVAPLLFVALSTTLFCDSLQARENSLKKGKWALQFEIDRDFDLKGFQGSTLSVKKHTADNRAYRLGLSISLDVDDGEIIQQLNDSVPIPGDKDFNSRGLGINLQKIYYVKGTLSIYPFFGIGAAASFYHSKNETEYRDASGSYVEYRKNTLDSWVTGLSGIFGVEWFFANDLSLLGEYSTFLNYSESNGKDEGRSVRNGSLVRSSKFQEQSHSFRISSSTVKFGLSVYF